MKKKTKKIAVIALLMFASFCTGIGYEKRLYDAIQDEWMEAAQEACDMRIKMIKFACRK